MYDSTTKARRRNGIYTAAWAKSLYKGVDHLRAFTSPLLCSADNPYGILYVHALDCLHRNYIASAETSSAAHRGQDEVE